MIKENKLLVIVFLVVILINLNGCTYQPEDKNLLATLPPLTEVQKLEAANAPEGMIYIPEGEYISGSPKEEKKFWLSAFYIDKYEVTYKKFQDFIADNPEWQAKNVKYPLQDGHYLESFGRYTGNKGTPTKIIVENGERYVSFSDGTKELMTFENYNWNEVSEDRYRYPVAYVTWFAAQAYCDAQGKRLPTSWEWEKAARGTDSRSFTWGSHFDGHLANFCDRSCPFSYHNKEWDDGFSSSAPVGSFPSDVSPYGIFDMGGNLAEWAADWAPDPQKDDPVKSGDHNPKGSETGVSRARMGRSWSSIPGLRYEVYYHSRFDPTRAVSDLGFRCAADVKE